jgi:hypothetical protein
MGMIKKIFQFLFGGRAARRRYRESTEMLFGYPVIYVEPAAKTSGGEIRLGDFSSYIAVRSAVRPSEYSTVAENGD